MLPKPLSKIIILLVFVLISGILFAQRQRPNPDEKPSDSEKDKTKNPRENISEHIKIIPDNKEYFIFLSPQFTYQKEIPLVDENLYDSSAIYFGFEIGGGLSLVNNFFFEGNLSYSSLMQLNYTDNQNDRKVTIDDLSQSLSEIGFRLGYNFINNVMPVDFVLGVQISFWGNRSFNGSVEKNSSENTLFLKTGIGIPVNISEKLKFKFNESFLYNLVPGHRRQVGVNRLFSVMLKTNLLVYYYFDTK
jgi:hypothetical protein